MKRRLLTLAGILGAAAAAVSLNLTGNKVLATVPGTNTLVSITSSGTSSIQNGTASDGGKLSQNGKFFGFVSGGNDVVSPDTNGNVDVFLRNLSANTNELISVSTSGVQANSSSRLGAISETGRYVLFTSSASNLIDGTTITVPYYKEQLYMRDTVANTTTLLSKNSSGTVADEGVLADSISSDGRFVLFETAATNLGPTVTNSNVSNLYMLDRTDGSFTILNYDYTNNLPSSGSYPPMAKMSCDGSLVVFQSAPNLTASYSPHVDVYLLDRRAGNKLTNLTLSGNYAAMSPSISCNGNYIGFSDFSNNLDPASGPTSYIRHAYVYDRISGTYTMVDKTSSGVEGNYGVDCSMYTSCVQISDNGIAAYPSNASNLISGGTSGTQVFVHSLTNGVTELLSRNASGTEGNNTSSNTTINTNGSLVGYGSYSTNLTSLTDNNNYTDAFTSLTGY